jgi:hypothetical protein
MTTLVTTQGPYSTLGILPDPFLFYPNSPLGPGPSSVALNDRGQVAFAASLDAGGYGIFTGPDPVANRVIATGDSLAGSQVADLGFFRDGFNDQGQVAFVAKLTNGLTEVFRADPEGSTQQNPVLPSSYIPGLFLFSDVRSGLWIDPPLVSGFTFAMTGPGSLFSGILDFPTGFNGLFDVLVDDVSLGRFGPGQMVDFSGFAGGGVASFSIQGIDPSADAGNPLSFPIRLGFTTPTASFTMSAAVPEPMSLTLMGLGIAGMLVLGAMRRRTGPPSDRGVPEMAAGGPGGS